MAKKLEKMRKAKLKDLEKRVAKALKAKGVSSKTKSKKLGKDKAIPKVLKQIEKLLGEHELNWRDLPITKHFATETKGQTQAKPAAKKTARASATKPPRARKPATKAGAKATRKPAAKKTTPPKPAARAGSATATAAQSRAKSTPRPKSTVKASSAAKPVAKKSVAARKPAAGQTAGKLPPKYRNPDDPSQTWAGRGPKPRWLQDYLADGGSLDVALIK